MHNHSVPFGGLIDERLINFGLDQRERETFFGPHDIEYQVWYSPDGKHIMNMPHLAQCTTCYYVWGHKTRRTDDLESRETCDCGNLLRIKLVGGKLRTRDGRIMRLVDGPPDDSISPLQELLHERIARAFDLDSSFIKHALTPKTTTETETNNMNLAINVVKVKGGVLSQIINNDDCGAVIWERLCTQLDIPTDNHGEPIFSLNDYAAKAARDKKNEAIAGLFKDDYPNTESLLPKPKK